MFETARFALNDSFMFAGSLVERFTNELASEQHNEHYLRSLAMKTELLALRGEYDNSLQKCNELRDVYNARKYSSLLSRTYGQDHCCQCIAQSALWSFHLQREDEASDTCDFVINTLLPSVDPRNVGHFFLMLYPVILVMKNLNRAKEARDVFEEYVVRKSDALLGKEGKSPDRTVHQAILILLDLAKEDCSVDEIQACANWALAEDSGIFSDALDLFTGSAGRTARSITAEICLRLSESEHVGSLWKPQLFQKGFESAKQSRALIGTAVAMSHALLVLEPIHEKFQAMNKR
jgi:hypothetical protein